jgi:hypothetical protein
MLAIVRVKTNDGSDILWNYIEENHTELEKQFDNCVEILYMTKREKYEDTSLLIYAGNPDCFGDFVANVIAPIPGVDEVWMFNMMNMKFYYLPEILLDEWKRFVVSIRVHPNKFRDVYNTLLRIFPTTEAAPVYLAYTFHIYGDSITLSLVAKDKKAADKFIEENVESLPDIHKTHITGIEKQERLTSPESWKLYIKSHLITKETIETKKESRILSKKVHQTAKI